jgi:hypothetical protein
MNLFFLEARALAKRYITERGTDLLDHLFSRVKRERLACLLADVAEVTAMVVRRRQSGRLTGVLADAALLHLHLDTQPGTPMRKLVAGEADLRAAVPLVETYRLGGREGLVLQMALADATSCRTAGDDVVLLTTDRPLLRAARRERLTTFDPETQTQAELDALIGS